MIVTHRNFESFMTSRLRGDSRGALSHLHVHSQIGKMVLKWSSIGFCFNVVICVLGELLEQRASAAALDSTGLNV